MAVHIFPTLTITWPQEAVHRNIRLGVAAQVYGDVSHVKKATFDVIAIGFSHRLLANCQAKQSQFSQEV